MVGTKVNHLNCCTFFLQIVLIFYSCPLNPVVSKASSGVMEVLDVYAAHDMPLVLQVC